MEITEQQLEIYLREIPPVIWAWIYTEVKDEVAKSALKAVLFDETEHAKDLTQPRIRDEVNYVISRFPEVRYAAEKCALKYYMRNSWQKWLPWNWKHW